MKLREGEYIKAVYHHHPTPFIYQLIKAFFVIVPFLLLVYMFHKVLSPKALTITLIVIFVIYVLFCIYLALIYWLDKIIVTNLRVIHIDWKYLTVKHDSAVMLADIQDIQTKERGFWSHFKFLDYGSIKIDSPSSYVTIIFTEAPNPEGMRHFISSLRNQENDTKQ